MENSKCPLLNAPSLTFIMSIECFVGNSEKQGRLLIQGVDPTGLEEHSYMNKNGYWTTEQVFVKVLLGKLHKL